MKFGSKPIPRNKLEKNRQKTLRKVINEISEFYSTKNDNINLIGSSYGSVIAAHVALQLIQCGNNIKTLTLSASPISQESELGKELMKFEGNEISKIVWHPNKDDNISGSSGNISIWKLMFPRPNSGTQSIILPSHPHNLARKHTYRTGQIVVETLINSNSEGDIIKNTVLDSLHKIPNMIIEE